MKATEIMEQTEGDAKICIAILDGLVDLNHSCFKNSKITKLETLVSGVAEEGPAANHGTHVASLIFGQRDSPIRGISPGCHGLIIPVFADGPDDSIKSCSQIDLAHAITQAVEQGAHIINISGGELVPSGKPHPLLDRAVRLCAENSVLIVAAAGNNGCACLHVPAAISSTLAVGAMDSNGLPLDFSNWGEIYQSNGVLAPGKELLGAVPGGGVATKSGTSFATPIVSGIVALLLSIQIQRGEKPDPYAVREAILQSAHPCFPSEGLDCSRYLKGRLNIKGAYNLVTKKQKIGTDSRNLIKQLPGNQPLKNTSLGLVEFSKKLPILGVKNVEFTILNPERVTPSTQSFVPDAMKSLENSDSIESKPIDKEKKKQTKIQIQEKNMTELVDNTCGCPKKQAKKEEKVELNDQKNDLNVPQIHASEVQVTESMITNKEADVPFVIPSQAPPTRSVGEHPSLVYALGTLSYDFGSEARRDAFIQSMEGDGPNPDEPTQLLNHLEMKPEYAESLIWTLDIESTPVYAIRPIGSFASDTYKQLRGFLQAQEGGKADKVSIPGIISGKVKLISGQLVPVIIPELRGMYCWNKESVTNSAVRAVVGSTRKPVDEIELESVKEGVSNFLERVYYELMNLGQSSQERAMNFAATNAFQAAAVFEQAIGEKTALDTIETERSPVCRPDSDCWDVKLTFFDPDNISKVARKVYRFTIDVSDVVPVSVGKVRSWSKY